MKTKTAKVISALAMALVMCANLSSHASAFNYQGLRHEVPKVYYHYDNWLDNNVRTAMSEACEAWKNKTTKITMQHGIAQSGSVDVYVAAGNMYDKSLGAFTEVEVREGTRFFASQSISFNTQTIAWDDTNAMKSIAAHEIGHVFGLGETAPGTQALMNKITYGVGSRYEDYNITTPQADDINGINYIYK